MLYTSVTHVGCECGSVSHVSQNKTQFMYNVYYKLNDAIHTNNVQLFTHSSMRENYIITILDLYPLTFRLHTWHINPLVCKALNTGVLGASLLLVRLQLPGLARTENSPQLQCCPSWTSGPRLAVSSCPVLPPTNQYLMYHNNIATMTIMTIMITTL